MTKTIQIMSLRPGDLFLLFRIADETTTFATCVSNTPYEGEGKDNGRHVVCLWHTRLVDLFWKDTTVLDVVL